MRSRWPLALIACALALAATRRAEARMAKSLDDCPIIKALSQATGGRSRRLPAPANPLTRVARGVKSIVLSPLEIPVTMGRVALERNIVAGATIGAIDGVAHGLSRLSAGVIDVVTAPIPGATFPLYERPLGKSSAYQYGVPLGYSQRR